MGAKTAAGKIRGRSDIYALRCLGMAGAERSAIPLLYETLSLSTFVWREGQRVPIDLELKRDAENPKTVSVLIRTDSEEVAEAAEDILARYHPSVDLDDVQAEQRAEDRRRRERRLEEAGWTGQSTMPSAAITVAMEGFGAASDPFGKGMWLETLLIPRIGAKDRARVSHWTAAILDDPSLDDYYWSASQLLARTARDDSFDRLVELCSQPHVGPSRMHLLRALVRLDPDRAEVMALRFLDEHGLVLAAIETLVRLKRPGNADRIAPLLESRTFALRRAARMALKSLGATVPELPSLVHKVSNRRRFGAPFVEWSTNLDADDLMPLLRVLESRDYMSEDEIREVMGGAERLRRDGTITFLFPGATGSTSGQGLGLQIYLEDVDTLDVWVWGGQPIVDALDGWASHR